MARKTGSSGQQAFDANDSSPYGAAVRLAISVILIALSFVLHRRGGAYTFPAPAYLALNGLVVVLGYPVFTRSLTALFARRRATVELLIAIVAVSALLIGQWLEAAAVVFVAILAEAIERSAALRSVTGLSRAAMSDSKNVLVRQDESMVEMRMDQLSPGQVLVVKQGMMIPADGVIAAGRAEIRESALTGESAFRTRTIGEKVFAGGMVESGTVEVRVERVGSSTTLAHVERLIKQAARYRSHTAGVVERLAGILVSAALIVGTGVFIFYGQFKFASSGASSLDALRRGLAVLITICPVAVVLAAPLGLYAGILRAARRGIVFKGQNVVEKLAKVRTLLMDKTGTLTYARPVVTQVKAFSVIEDRVIESALFVEQRSNHPIARAICEYAGKKNIKTEVPDRFHEFEGGGAGAIKGNRHVKIGALWLIDDGRDIPAEVTQWLEETSRQGSTAVLVADQESVLGGFVIEDELREDAKETLAGLRKAGIRQIAMVTGDNREVAARVEKMLGLDACFAECMPDMKLKKISDEKIRGHLVAMVGDGINDAPALAAADVGIAMGAMGSDIAIDAAEIALLENNLSRLLDAYRGSRQVMQTIRTNLALVIVGTLCMVGFAFTGVVGLFGVTVFQMFLATGVAVNSFLLLLRPT